MAGGQEKQPLLGQAEPIPSAQEPPPYIEQPAFPQPYTGETPSPYPTPANPAPYPPPDSYADSGDQAPPPYSAIVQNTFVQCRVCQCTINIPTGSTSRVVKCNSCNEATPITAPPPGKKFVRCPCNCLLTCSVSATTVLCPRANCKRTIRVTMDRMRVNCGHCHRPILWPSNAAAARCPHCRKSSKMVRTITVQPIDEQVLERLNDQQAKTNEPEQKTLTQKKQTDIQQQITISSREQTAVTRPVPDDMLAAAQPTTESMTTLEQNKELLKDYTADQIADLLDKIGLGKYKETFKENEVDGETFLTLTDEELMDLTLFNITSKLHRSRVMKIINGETPVPQ